MGTHHSFHQNSMQEKNTTSHGTQTSIIEAYKDSPHGRLGRISWSLALSGVAESTVHSDKAPY